MQGAGERRRAPAPRSRGRAHARRCRPPHFDSARTRATHRTDSARHACSSASGSCVAAVIEDAAGQDGCRTFEPNLSGDGVGGKPRLHGVEQIAREDGLVLPTMHLAYGASRCRAIAPHRSVLKFLNDGCGTEKMETRYGSPNAPHSGCRSGWRVIARSIGRAWHHPARGTNFLSPRGWLPKCAHRRHHC